MKVIEEQAEPIPTPEEVQDPSYIQWQMFNEISERLYTIEWEGYFDKNCKTLDDETTIKHQSSGEHKLCVDDVIEYYDENCNFLCYADYTDSLCYCINHNKYDLRKITKKIRSMKFICEAPIGSGKSITIRK